MVASGFSTPLTVKGVTPLRRTRDGTLNTPILQKDRAAADATDTCRVFFMFFLVTFVVFNVSYRLFTYFVVLSQIPQTSIRYLPAGSFLNHAKQKQ